MENPSQIGHLVSFHLLPHTNTLIGLKKFDMDHAITLDLKRAKKDMSVPHFHQPRLSQLPLVLHKRLQILKEMEKKLSQARW